MLPDASAGVIAALKTSLADAAAVWVVTNVTESRGARIGSVETSAPTDTVSGLDGMHTFVTSVSVSANSAETVVTQIDLVARALAMNGAAGLAVSYLSVWIDDEFDHGIIGSSGGSYRSADEALDTAIRSKATPFLEASDDTLLEALEAGPQLGAGEFIVDTTLADLKTSLADEDAGWTVTALNTTRFGRETMVSVIVQAANVAMPLGTSLRAQVSYSARLIGDVLIEANVLVRGGQWRVVDAELHATMMALADTFRADQADLLADALADE